MLTIILTAFALISAILTIIAKTRGSEKLQFIFKPAAMLAIISIAFVNSANPFSNYQILILLGLVFSAVGDVFLIKDDRFFVHGLVSFLIGHLFYVAAFYTQPNLIVGILYLGYVIIFLTILWKNLGKLKIPVIIYSLTLAAMSWFALGTTLANHNHHTFHAFLGSIVFIISDSLLACNKFKAPFRLAHVFVLGTYFLAQWLIALSV